MQTVTQGPLTLSPPPSTPSPYTLHLLSPVLQALRKTWKVSISFRTFAERGKGGQREGEVGVEESTLNIPRHTVDFQA